MRKLLIVGLGLSVCGCSTITGDDGLFRDRAKDYHGSTLVAPLEYPSDIEKPYQSDLYPISAEYAQDAMLDNLEPPDFGQGEEG